MIITPNLRALALVLVGLSYLFMGAAIFSAIEKQHEAAERIRLFAEEAALRFQYNISNEDYINLTRVILLLEPHKAGIQWEFAGALYFAITVVTTIGYGHSVPHTSGGKIFCMIYSIIGVPIGLVMFQSTGERINNAAKYLLKKIGRKLGIPFKEVSHYSLVPVGIFSCCLTVAVGCLSFHYFEKWPFLDSLYYCVVTLTTIGFGDYVALQSDGTMQNRPSYVAFSFIYIMVGLTVIGAFLNLVVLRLMVTTSDDDKKEEDNEVNTSMVDLEENNPVTFKPISNSRSTSGGGRGTTGLYDSVQYCESDRWTSNLRKINSMRAPMIRRSILPGISKAREESFSNYRYMRRKAMSCSSLFITEEKIPNQLNQLNFRRGKHQFQSMTGKVINSLNKTPHWCFCKDCGSLCPWRFLRFKATHCRCQVCQYLRNNLHENSTFFKNMDSTCNNCKLNNNWLLSETHTSPLKPDQIVTSVDKETVSTSQQTDIRDFDELIDIKELEVGKKVSKNFHNFPDKRTNLPTGIYSPVVSSLSLVSVESGLFVNDEDNNCISRHLSVDSGYGGHDEKNRDRKIISKDDEIQKVGENTISERPSILRIRGNTKQGNILLVPESSFSFPCSKFKEKSSFFAPNLVSSPVLMPGVTPSRKAEVLTQEIFVQKSKKVKQKEDVPSITVTPCSPEPGQINEENISGISSESNIIKASNNPKTIKPANGIYHNNMSFLSYKELREIYDKHKWPLNTNLRESANEIKNKPSQKHKSSNAINGVLPENMKRIKILENNIPTTHICYNGQVHQRRNKRLKNGTLTNGSTFKKSNKTKPNTRKKNHEIENSYLYSDKNFHTILSQRAAKTRRKNKFYSLQSFIGLFYNNNNGNHHEWRRTRSLIEKGSKLYNYKNMPTAMQESVISDLNCCPNDDYLAEYCHKSLPIKERNTFKTSSLKLAKHTFSASKYMLPCSSNSMPNILSSKEIA